MSEHVEAAVDSVKRADARLDRATSQTDPKRAIGDVVAAVTELAVGVTQLIGAVQLIERDRETEKLGGSGEGGGPL